MNWQEYIWGLIAAVILIPLAGFVAAKLRALAQTTTLRIELKIPDDTIPTGVYFGVLHVRDGTDQQDDKGPLRNKELSFRRRSPDALIARVRYTRRLGCQFKCFAKHAGVPFDEIKGILERLGFEDVTVGEGKQFRAWFVVPNYRVVEAAGNIKNNFHFPA